MESFGVADTENCHIGTCLICFRKFKSSLASDCIKKEVTADPHDIDNCLNFEPRTVRHDELKGLHVRFFKLFGRMFRLQSLADRLLSSTATTSQLFCATCGVTVSKLCDYYADLEVLKIKTKWILKELGETMENSLVKVSAKLKKQVVVAIAKEIGAKSTQSVEIWLKVIRIKCKQSWKKSDPRVSLARGLSPEEWKFPYSATKSTLMRLILIFALGLCFPSKKPLIQKNPGALGEVVKTEVAPRLDENDSEIEDHEGGDSDWSTGIASPAQSAVSEDDDSEPEIKRSRRCTRRSTIQQNYDEDSSESLSAKSKKSYNFQKSGKTWSCSLCTQSFRSNYCLRSHLRNEHGETRPRGRPASSTKKGKTSLRPRPQRCSICNLQLPNLRTLKSHIRNDHPDCPFEIDGKYGTYVCDVCTSSYSTEDALQKHFSLLHNSSFKCATCQTIFPCRDTLWSHLVSHESDEDIPFACHLCLQGFTNEQLYNIHRKYAHGIPSKWLCDDPNCFKVFTSVADLNEHIKSHISSLGADSQLHLCETCGIGFVDKKRKIIHQVGHTQKKSNGKGYPCPECSYCSRELSHMIVHFNNSHGVDLKPIRCKLCGMRFVTAGIFENHCKVKHSDSLEVVKILGKFIGKRKRKYTRDTNLTALPQRILENPSSPPPVEEGMSEKMKTIRNLKLFGNNTKLKVNIPKCPVDGCEEQPVSYYRLRKHLELKHEDNVPRDEQSFWCFHCSQIFKYELTRSLHARAAHGNRIQCDFEKCEVMAFKNIGELDDHLKTHLDIGAAKESGDGIKRCGKCNWGFFNPTMLQLHELYHVEPENGQFKCTSCDVRCFTPRGLRNHFSMFHLQTEVLECEMCGATFATQNRLRRHKMREHSGIGVEPSEAVLEELSKARKEILERKRAQYSLHGGKERRLFVRGLRARKKRPREAKIPCLECGDLFKTNYHLATHQKRAHGKVLRYTCKQCPASFEQRRHMEEHMEKHEKRVYMCDICGVNLSRRPALMRHKRSKHSDVPREERICQVCGKAFMSLTGLEWHVLADHTPQSEWKLSCDKCGKKFYRHTLKNGHMKNCKATESWNQEENLNS